jgi:hypothetical protein
MSFASSAETTGKPTQARVTGASGSIEVNKTEEISMTKECKRVIATLNRAQIENIEITTPDLMGKITLCEVKNLLERLCIKNDLLFATLEQVKKERDSAVWDSGLDTGLCAVCAHYKPNTEDSDCELMHYAGNEIEGECCWAWRGPCKENGGKENDNE